MSTNKNYCMSSYLAFRYIEKDDMDFYDGMKHSNIKPVPESEKILVKTAGEIDSAIQKVFDDLKEKKLGIMLSGGMDSAILASYMRGCDAYTFRFLGGELWKEEFLRAEYYAKYYGLKLHYVDIDWNVVEKNVDAVMKVKCAPVHSIEPQILEAALQAKGDGIELMVVGESSDLIFGGMDQLLAKDWNFDEFVKRYMFTDPKTVLNEPVDMSYLFDRYRQGEKIDFLKFMDDVFSVESSMLLVQPIYHMLILMQNLKWLIRWIYIECATASRSILSANCLQKNIRKFPCRTKFRCHARLMSISRHGKAHKERNSARILI